MAEYVRSTNEKELRSAVVEYSSTMPRELIEKIRDGKPLSVEERTKIVQWVITSDTLGAEEIHEAVVKALLGEDLDDVQREAVGTWLAHGPTVVRWYDPSAWQEPSLWEPNEFGDHIPALPAAGDVAPMPPAP
jgi:hypothetical protein